MIDLNHSQNLSVRWLACCLRLPLALPVLTAVLVLSTPAVVQAQFSYTVTNQMVTITGYQGTTVVVAIPSTIDGLPVTSLKPNTFLESSVTSVTIPNSVTSIGNPAFSSLPFISSLTDITVDSANQNYSSIGGVLFDKGQTTLIQYPSAKAGASYTIPNSVTRIGDSAFAGCASLTHVTIGNGVTSIGVSAFSEIGDERIIGCPLINVTIPNSVTNIGDSAFAGCASLTHVTIGNGVTSIGNSVFSSCSSLTRVTIPNSVTNIGAEAFNELSFNFPPQPGLGLTSVTIPNSVTSIGNGAFRDTSLT